MSTKLIPILFSTPMVQAILQGQKTMTRRTKGLDKISPLATEVTLSLGFNVDALFKARHKKENTTLVFEVTDLVKCPYGKVGDVLWVRESFTPKRHSFPIGEPFEYKATAEEDGNPTEGPWKPSIHMPFAACRIFLRITDLRVERLNDISEQDAKAEGVETLGLYPRYDVSSKGKFEGLWNLINGAESWNANPWVWVISFERCEKPTA